MFDIVAVSEEIKGTVGNFHPDWQVRSSHDDFGNYECRSIFLDDFKPSDLTLGKVQAATSFSVTPRWIRISGRTVIPHTAPDWKANLIAALGGTAGAGGPGATLRRLVPR
jgi:hypothetical protein